ncbi:hypothetical protein [Candidatus Uabimicrobium sp. HlEnr_7]|uniref:hypothetical protein n=1 Tax=Candidatus Uabimicrobium helgolandensis TaxID=3095367 RepID=UPI00355905D4
MRQEGMLDWQIQNCLGSIILYWRLEQKYPGTPDCFVFEKMNEFTQGETAESLFPPLSLFSKERVDIQKAQNLITTLQSWNLEIRQKIPDFKAIEHFLVHRYQYSIDDIKHKDPFPKIV